MDPVITMPCVVCGGQTFTVISSAHQVREDLVYLRRFHRRRLRLGPQGPSREEALADRSDFTQDYVTDIVTCTTCGCVCRSPRPTTQTITRAYAQDHYGQMRLEALFATQAPGRVPSACG